MWHLQEIHKKKHWKQHCKSVETSNANTHHPKITPKTTTKNNHLYEFWEPKMDVSNRYLSTALEVHW